VVVAPPVRFEPSGGSSGARCPRCRAAFDRSEPSCAACGGRFLSHAALATLVESALEEKTEPRVSRHKPLYTTVRYVPCPSCGETMNRMNFGGRSGIIVDTCRMHGTWFDAGELEAVLDFVRAGGVDPLLTRKATPLTEDELTAKEADALLQVELLREQREHDQTLSLVEDVVWVLFSTPEERRWRRRWR
jgi:Zn-finger nucleic acid-binding protein